MFFSLMLEKVIRGTEGGGKGLKLNGLCQLFAHAGYICLIGEEMETDTKEYKGNGKWKRIQKNTEIIVKHQKSWASCQCQED